MIYLSSHIRQVLVKMRMFSATWTCNLPAFCWKNCHSNAYVALHVCHFNGDFQPQTGEWQVYTGK